MTLSKVDSVSNPLISVIMSTYNTPKEWLLLSINSILNQTYTNFELIIVDDGTKEYSVEELIKEISDDRIELIINPSSVGLTKSLNMALKHCTGDYVVRMDSDDISEVVRFEKQIRFMENNPECVACGSWFKKFGSSHDLIKSHLPNNKELLKVKLLFGNVNLAHPSVMIRRSILLKHCIHYNEEFKKAQDYEMWTQLSEFGYIGVVKKSLLNYRVHNNQISVSQSSEQDTCMQNIRINQLRKTGVDINDFNTLLHSQFCLMQGIENPETMYKWIKSIISANNSTKHFNPKVLKLELDFRWYVICIHEYKINKNRLYKEYMKKCSIKSKLKYNFLLLIKWIFK